MFKNSYKEISQQSRISKLTFKNTSELPKPLQEELVLHLLNICRDILFLCN